MKFDKNFSLNEFAKEVHKNAVEHGWWDKPRRFGEIIALCHSELSEALEEYRNGRPMFWQSCSSANGAPCMKDGCGDWNEGVCELNAIGDKPEGVAVEMIDCIIRILDWCGKEGVDIEGLLQLKHEYNKTRPYKHGGKTI
jgi:hypothetical protein